MTGGVLLSHAFPWRGNCGNTCFFMRYSGGVTGRVLQVLGGRRELDKVFASVCNLTRECFGAWRGFEGFFFSFFPSKVGESGELTLL
jgi:hypothetical protein